MKEDYPTMLRTDVSLNNEGRNRLIYDELRYDRNVLRNEHDRLMSTITSAKKKNMTTLYQGLLQTGLVFFSYMDTVEQVRMTYVSIHIYYIITATSKKIIILND